MMSPQHQDQPENFIPFVIITRTLRYWWVLAALMILGAFIANLIHTSRPALYEARIEIDFTLDYNRTGPLTQFQEDYAVEVIGALMRNPSILQELAEMAAENDYPITPQDLAASSRIERRMYTWVIRVFDADRPKADWLAEQWADRINERIAYAFEHAVIAEQLQRHLDSSEACVAFLPVSGQSTAACNSMGLEELQSKISAVTEQIQYHRMESSGLASYLLISKAEVIPTGSHPVRQGRNVFLLAGSLLGAMAGIAALSFDFPKIFRK